MSKNKFHNKKIILPDGTVFDSTVEYKYYEYLKGLDKQGAIRYLGRQKRYELIPKQEDEQAVTYMADFVIFDKNVGKECVIDVKSLRTALNPDYIIKRKLFKHVHRDKEFREVCWYAGAWRTVKEALKIKRLKKRGRLSEESFKEDGEGEEYGEGEE